MAIAHLAQGRLVEAKKEALAVPGQDPEYAGAQRLLRDIDRSASRLADKHMALAREYESASMPSLALMEYKRAELMRLTSTPAESTPAEGVPAASTDQGVDRRFALGRAKFQEKQYRESIDELKAVLRFDPANAQVRELLGRVKKERDLLVSAHLKKGLKHFEQEELDKALGEWSRAVELDPENAVAIDYRERARVMQETLRRIEGGQPER